MSNTLESTQQAAYAHTSELDRQRFDTRGLLVVSGLVSPEAVKAILPQLDQHSLFTKTRALEGDRIAAARLHSFADLGNTALGDALDAVRATGKELAIDLEHETHVLAPWKDHTAHARVAAYHIPQGRRLGVDAGDNKVSAVLPLASRLWVCTRWLGRLVEPGDVAFVNHSRYSVATSRLAQPETATAIIVAGENRRTDTAAA